jgi:tRNA (guanine26-N2/guanine27-N2)-dimethyltransferase
VHCTPPKAAVFRSAIINAGYKVSGSHANPLALKTTAPPEVLWDIVRCWVQQHPVKGNDPNSYAGKLLAKEPKLVANFGRAAGAVSASQLQGVTRFVQNPAFWGPKARHGRPPKGGEQQQQQEGKKGKGRKRQEEEGGEEEEDVGMADGENEEQQQQKEEEGVGEGKGEQELKREEEEGQAAAAAAGEMNGTESPKKEPAAKKQKVETEPVTAGT